MKESLRTWIEINKKACEENYKTFRSLLDPHVKLWSVVKSNAYGHGLFVFSKIADELGIDGFCVDSLVEGLKLRRVGIKKHILVLGPTLPNLFGEARKRGIVVSISNFEGLRALLHSTTPPAFHIKIDTGMHRQGFYINDVPKVVSLIKRNRKEKHLQGVFTHFAAAKDIKHQTYTETQLLGFYQAIKVFEKHGFRHLIKHCAATGGTLLGKKYHLNAVRVGIGLYGLWPSPELERQLRGTIHLNPILRWRAVVAEVKKLRKGDSVGYDLTKQVKHPTTMAVLPIGYWHGFPRALSNKGKVLIRGKEGNVLGRVSMDLLTVDVDGIPCRVGDEVTLIGKDGNRELRANDVAGQAGTTHYEFLTRLNPLIERIIT